jgi:uncharacterized protein
MFGKEIRCVAPEFRAAKSDDGKKQIFGYAAVFDSWSENLGWFREKIAPGAFSRVIKAGDAVALFNHDANMPLGRQSNGTLRLNEDDTGLMMEVDLPDTQYANDLYKLVERGDIRQQSFAFSVAVDEWAYGKDGQPDERTIVEVKELFDVSPVTYPAYPDTSVAKRSFDTSKPDEIVGTDDEIVIENENIDIDLILTRND